METLTTEIKLLLALSKPELNIDERKIIDDIILSVKNWDLFFECAVDLGIGPIVNYHLARQKQINTIPPDIISRFDQTYLLSLRRNMVLIEYFQIIQENFAAHQIPCIPLKGIYLAESLYKDIGLRQMSDIDLLVKEKDIQTCLNILSDMGYIAVGRVKSEFIKNQGVAKHLPTMVLDDALVEIHFRILVDGTYHSINIEDYWNNSQIITLYEQSVLALSAEDLVQYLCIHLERHFNEGKIQLYQFADIHGILKKNEETFYWDKFHLSCHENNCEKNVCNILFLLTCYFSLSLPDKTHQLVLKNKDINTEKLFLSLIDSDKKGIFLFNYNQNLKEIKGISGIKNKFRYAIEDIFPTKSFMVNRYRIKNCKL